MEIIQTRQQLVELAKTLGVRADWHEPDEQGITADVEGGTFDNAGFWPTATVMGWVTASAVTRSVLRTMRGVEQHVVLYKRVGPDDDAFAESEPVAVVNLATLFAWACGHES
jgi:hypothetical protein